MERNKSRIKDNQKGISRLSVIILIIVIVVVASIALGLVTKEKEPSNTVGTPKNEISNSTEEGTKNETETENEVKNQIIVPAGHKHDFKTVVRTVAATCTESSKSYLGCECGAERVTIDGPSLGHAWTQKEVTKNSTCQEEGEMTYTCSACGQTRVEKLPTTIHDFSSKTINDDFLKEPAGCTTLAVYFYKCANCDEKGTNTYTEGEALGHAWNEGEVTKEATETEDGERELTCTVCEKTRTEKIPALNK